MFFQSNTGWQTISRSVKLGQNSVAGLEVRTLSSFNKEKVGFHFFQFPIDPDNSRNYYIDSAAKSLGINRRAQNIMFCA